MYTLVYMLVSTRPGVSGEAPCEMSAWCCVVCCSHACRVCPRNCPPVHGHFPSNQTNSIYTESTGSTLERKRRACDADERPLAMVLVRALAACPAIRLHPVHALVAAVILHTPEPVNCCPRALQCLPAHMQRHTWQVHLRSRVAVAAWPRHTVLQVATAVPPAETQPVLVHLARQALYTGPRSPVLPRHPGNCNRKTARTTLVVMFLGARGEAGVHLS